MMRPVRLAFLPSAVIALCAAALTSLAAPPPPGHLWHTSTWDSDARGTKMLALAKGRSVRVSPDIEAIPWPDGRQFATSDHSVSDQRTTLVVTDTATGRPRTSVNIDGYWRGSRPAPGHADWLMGRWSPTTNDPKVYTVAYDVVQQRLLFATQKGESDHVFDWLPDNRLLRLTPGGQISAITLGGKPGQQREERLLNVQWPPGHRLEQVRTSPDGRRLLVLLNSGRDASPTLNYWIVNLHDGALRQHTASGIASQGHWSPDGRLIAVEYDTGSTCSGSRCYGTCRLRFAPADARDVTGLDAAQDTSPFMVLDSYGERQKLICGLLAWTT